MNLITEITNKAAALPPAKQREALEIIEKLTAQPLAISETQIAQSSRAGAPPLKGATAREGKSSISEDEIKRARREMWGRLSSED